LKIGVFEGTGSVWPNISGRRGLPQPTILPVRKLDKGIFIWYKNVGSRLFYFVREHEFDGRTAGQTDFGRKVVRICNRSRTVKTLLILIKFGMGSTLKKLRQSNVNVSHLSTLPLKLEIRVLRQQNSVCALFQIQNKM